MPVEVQCDDFVLSLEEVGLLWKKTIGLREYRDDDVVVRCVSREEIRKLNRTYRRKDVPTNVLTFSYGDGAHDVAFCREVAQEEVVERQAELRDYAAYLLVHAFLHVCGLDHEESDEARETMQEAERTILMGAGFADVLSL